MDRNTFIAELIKALAWPGTVVITVVFFRIPIIGLLEGLKLRKLRRGDWEAEFTETAQGVRSELPVTTENPPKTDGGLAEEYDHLIKSSPTEAVIAVWNRIEHSIGLLAGLHSIPGHTFVIALNGLAEKSIIDVSTKSAVLGLRQLRNLAVHGPRGGVSENRARDFIVMADSILWVLSTIADKSKKHS